MTIEINSHFPAKIGSILLNFHWTTLISHGNYIGDTINDKLSYDDI
jgi:hypothetical protein